jgi:hypothetical protein
MISILTRVSADGEQAPARLQARNTPATEAGINGA